MDCYLHRCNPWYLQGVYATFFLSPWECIGDIPQLIQCSSKDGIILAECAWILKNIKEMFIGMYKLYNVNYGNAKLTLTSLSITFTNFVMISLALTNNYRHQYYIFWENAYWHLQNVVNCNEIANKSVIGIDKLVNAITNVDVYFIDVDNF